MRLYYLDSARALLMVTGVPFHVAMIYAPSASWMIDSPQDTPALGFLASAIHTFRMPAFFLIAGFFAALIGSRKGTVPWVKERCIRLGVPLITSIGTIIPIHVAILSGYGNVRGLNIAHLWFLVVLVLYCAAYACITISLRQWQLPFRSMSTIILCVGVGLYQAAVYNIWGLPKHIYGFPAWHLAQYAPYFSIGVLFQSRPEAWAKFIRVRWSWITISIGVIATVTFFDLTGSYNKTFYNFTAGLGGLMGSYLVISLCKKYLSKPSRRVSGLVDSSLSIYLLHHPIVLAMGFTFLRLNLNPMIEFLVISFGSFFASLLIHLYIIAPHSWVRFAYNGNMPTAVARTHKSG